MEIKKPFWKWVFCESDGTPSFSRICTGVLVGFACGWITSIVIRTASFPEMGGLAMLIGVLYGANKFATAAQGGPR